MAAPIVKLDDQYYLNLCTKGLARNSGPVNARGMFPYIDTASPNLPLDKPHNCVSFIFKGQPGLNISVIGTFANLFEPLGLQPVKFLQEDTGFYALSVLIPEGEIHRYLFSINGDYQLDPLNHQIDTLDDKSQWSRFFTSNCFVPLVFEEWELAILYRIFDHILPFHSKDTENFLNRFYEGLDKQAKLNNTEGYHRLDASMGEVNFVDKLLAKDENHHLIDYKICLKEIDRLLRIRNPFIEPANLPREFYDSFYDEMANGQISGWDYQAYSNPLYFLQILRRHAVMGAFSHPKYGGNSGGAGWAFLGDRYRDEFGQTLFDWRAAIEKPLGTNQDYIG